MFIGKSIPAALSSVRSGIKDRKAIFRCRSERSLNRFVIRVYKRVVPNGALNRPAHSAAFQQRQTASNKRVEADSRVVIRTYGYACRAGPPEGPAL
jgi:hypothetical protein